MGAYLVVLFASVVVGAVMGLIPYFLGCYMGKRELGQLGFICCALTGLIHWGLPFLVAFCFVFAIFLMKDDISIRKKRAPVQPDVAFAAPAGRSGSMTLNCLSGPLKGQRYAIGAGGLMFGRDNDCHVRFPPETPGISRHHCCIRWQNGVPVLIDLNSTYGTFLADGRQLMPNNPVRLMSGSRFLLGSGGCQFQVIMQ